MAKVCKTSLTFAVTIPDVMGMSIQETRLFILNALKAEQKAVNPDERIKDVDLSKVKVSLTNKEVTYGKR